MPSSAEKYHDSRRVLLQDSILSVLASLLAVLLMRWLTSAVPGFVSIVLRWLGCALVASLVGFFATGCYRYVRRYATIRSLGHVVLAVVVKEALLAVVLLVRLVPFSSAMMALSLLLADLLLTSVFLLYIRVSARSAWSTSCPRRRRKAGGGKWSSVPPSTAWSSCAPRRMKRSR